MRLITALVVAMALLAACSGAGSQAGAPPPGAPAGATPLPTTAPDRTTVTGRIISTRTNQPLPDTVVRLAEVTRAPEDPSDGVYLLDEARSPGGRTDASGQFVIANIPAKEYVLIISSDDGRNAIVTQNSGSGEARVWSTEAGKVVNFGEVRVDWP
ncbi:MAG TPA: hypothetical protein VNL77_22840 [Roseiflexaceae bacterium]|nr:hypothetical protein [Roseiflexaceae bacterium]